MDGAEDLTITVSPDMIRDLRDRVAARAYASPSEIVRDALRLRQERRREDAAIIEGIRARIRQSLDDPRPNMSLTEVNARVSDV